MKQILAGIWKKYGSVIVKILAIVAVVLFYRCPARTIFNMDCPGCGLTRACLSALRFDFKAAFEYHPLFPLFGAWMVYFILYEPINRKIKVNTRFIMIAAVVTSVAFIVVWIARTFI